MIISHPRRDERLALRAAQRHGRFLEVEMPPLPEIPGQITQAEGRFLYWLARDTYVGAGAIVEVGSWLGRSAAHLAAGLRDSGVAGELHCIDRFTWDEHLPIAGGESLKIGDNTLPLFEAHVRPIFAGVVAHRAELDDFRWPGGPIELLFLDAPKGWDNFVHALATFGPFLAADSAYVASQDFAYPIAFAQVICVARLRECFEPVHSTGLTAGFVLRRPLPSAAELRALLRKDAASVADDRRVWDALLERIGDDRFRNRLAPNFAMYLARRGSEREAVAHLRSCELDKRTLELWRSMAKDKRRPEYTPLFEALGIESRPR